MSETKVGVPTMGSLKGALGDYIVGAGGGLLYALSTAFTGSGLLGGLIGAGIAGSVIKGARGTTIATILGFQTIVSGSLGGASASAPEPEVM